MTSSKDKDCFMIKVNYLNILHIHTYTGAHKHKTHISMCNSNIKGMYLLLTIDIFLCKLKHLFFVTSIIHLELGSEIPSSKNHSKKKCK